MQIALAGLTAPREPDPETSYGNNTLCTQYHCCPEQPHPQLMDCSYHDLSLLREIFVPPPTLSLSLQHNSISRLERGAFVWAPTLLQLDLSDNNITSISRGWWLPDRRKRNSSSALERLSLAKNLLRFVNRDSFEGLDTVVCLDLSYNRISVLRDDIFTGLRSLEELVLDYNPLFYVRGDAFAALRLLRVLQMNHVGDVTLTPNAFRFLSSLSTLGLAGNDFREVPSTCLQDLVSLESLDLSENLFSELSPLFLRGLPVLRRLRLNNLVQLTGVEATAFGDMPNLKELHLSYNPKMTQVHPDAFYNNWSGSYVRLSELHLRHSGLHSLPQQLQDWGTLVVLDLSENAWICDCRLRWMAAVVDELPPAYRPICATPQNVAGRPVGDLLPFEFSCHDSGSPELTSSITMLCAMIVSAVASFLGVMLYNRCSPVQLPNYSRLEGRTV
ncbi:uncharacterized protein LOC144094593 [Amblyomma americanum]